MWYALCIWGGVRLIILIFFVAALACEGAEKATGRWEGSVQIPGRAYDLIVDLDQSNGKDWTGSIIIPGLGIKGAPLSDIVCDGSTVSFAVKGALASERTGNTTLKARLTNAGEMTGEFLQAGNSAPFVLRKTGPPEVELPRRSTALSNELAGQWNGDYATEGYTRHVTLTMTNHAAGAATAQLVVIGKRTTNAPVDLIAEDAGFLTIESHQFGIIYEGRFNREAGEIKGTWTLGPFELPLTLRRTP